MIAIPIEMLGVLLSYFLIASIAEPSLGCFGPRLNCTRGRSDDLVDVTTPEGNVIFNNFHN